MTDQRPIDVSTLRDGDIVRAKRGEHGVVEGRWSGNVGSWRIEDRRAGLDLARSHQGGWTITDIIRPVLVKGDRVEWIGAPRKRKASTATVSQVNGDRAAVIRDDDVCDEWPISVIRRLPAAPESDPVCPFPMGARVVPVDGWTKVAKIVTDWHPANPGAPFVVWTRPESMPDGCETWAPADYWTLAPEPAPIEVGDWWADEEGIPHVVEVLHDDSVGLRRWTASVVNRFVEPSLLRDYWTRLDGPPEPPEGSIIRMGQKGNRIPFAAMRCNDVWRLTGYQEPLSWADLTSSATIDLATLQIVHTLEAE